MLSSIFEHEGMTEALARIEQDFEAFRDAVVRCRSAVVFRRADLQDAYGRLARVRDRYLKEKDALDPSERPALEKAMESDTFFRGMMDFRQVGEHVTKRRELTIRTVDNVPIHLDFDTSAMAAFAAPIVTLPDTQGVQHRIDHLKLLNEAEKRIGAALGRVRA